MTAAPNLGLTSNIIKHVGPRLNVSVQFASICCLALPETGTQPTYYDVNEAGRSKQTQIGIGTRTEHHLDRELRGKRNQRRLRGCEEAKRPITRLCRLENRPPGHVRQEVAEL